MKPQKAMRRIAEAFRDDKLSVVVVMSDGRTVRGRIVDSSAVREGPMWGTGVPSDMAVAGPIKVTLMIEVGA